MNNPEQIAYKLTPFTRIQCGLGWDMAENDGEENDFDLDLVALCLDSTGKLPRGKSDFVYAGNP